MNVTKDDILNNPGVDEKTIAEVKSQYHFHKLSSVVLRNSTLICTFSVDEDPSSIYYTLPENGKEPVREYKLGQRHKEYNTPDNISITRDGLAVRIMFDGNDGNDGNDVKEELISSDEIWGE